MNPFLQALITILAILGGSFILLGPGPISTNKIAVDHFSDLNQKIYVAIEGEAKIAVIDPVEGVVIKNIDIADFSPHNVQVSPDNKTVWVTGNSAGHGHSFLPIKSANADTGEILDQVIVINPSTDAIIKRVQIGAGIHLAHVVLTPDSRYAYVTAQVQGMIHKIDAKSYRVIKSIATGEKSEPHGLRISPDSKFAYVAMLGNKSLGVVDLKTDRFSEVPLGGASVQTGITPNNKFAVVSLYDTKQLAVYRISDGSISYINLPATARGPIQMYPTPDSRFIYLADQGYYFSQPSSQWVYKIDIETKKVTKEIKAGKAPHGVVVSADGKFVYVTNLLSGDVSVIDTARDEEVKTIKVGKEPNGVSIWYKNN